MPGARRDLFDEFASALAGWEWDVALLQEVPPWWPSALAARLDAGWRRVLTSRNALSAVRRALAVRWPDVMKSSGGGSNAILVRGVEIEEHRTMRLCWLPERRWMHAVRLGNGWWIANLHAAADARQGARAAETLLGWKDGAPVVLGGDFNVHDLVLPGYIRAGGSGPDQAFVTGGLAAEGAARVLEHGRLSDHAPVLVSVIVLPE